MDIRIIVETTTEMGSKRIHALRRLRFSSQVHGDLGLKLEDAKDLLGRLQRAVLNAQIEEISDASRNCGDCSRTRPVHDYRTRIFDTLFGRFRVKVPRLCTCPCNAEERSSISPFAQVFPDLATPELQRLQAELGARHSFREAARILETFFPCAEQHNTTVRNRLGRIADDITNADPPKSQASKSQPVTVFIDGPISGADRNIR